MIDDILAARIDDAVRLSRKSAHFVGFLDPAERLDVESYLVGKKTEYLTWGGYPDAERCFIGFFPDYIDPSEDLFPLVAVTVKFDKRYELDHRDFLGSFMAQGISRASVGDILIENGRAVVFVREELVSFLLDNIFKIGKVGVSLSLGLEGELPQGNSFEEKTVIVASERLDCVVAALCGLSREKSSAAIKGGLVRLNYRECMSVSQQVTEGSTISVRGKGKYIVDTACTRTKKGRLVLNVRKYK